MSHEKVIFDGVRTRFGVRKSREMTLRIHRLENNEYWKDRSSPQTSFRRSPARKGFRSGSSPMSHEKAIFDGVRTRLGVRESREMTLRIHRLENNEYWKDRSRSQGR